MLTGRQAARVAFMLVALAGCVSAASATVVGVLKTSSGNGTMTITLPSFTFNIDTTSNPPGPPWDAEVANTTSLMFAGCPSGVLGTAGCLDSGAFSPAEAVEVANGNPVVLGAGLGPNNPFLQFAGNGITHATILYTATSAGPGSSNTNCAAAADVGDSCSIFAGSPLILTKSSNGTTITFTVAGTVTDGAGTTLWEGGFVGLIAGQNPGQVQLFFCPSGTCTPADFTSGKSLTFSQSGDFVATPAKPPQTDFDGDGLADKVIFRPSNGTWYVRRSDGGGNFVVQWGASGDIPAPGNYGGDGRADYAVFRPSNGIWYVRTSEGTALPGVQWGASGDIPVPGNYGGDARVDFAVWRPSNGTWYVRTAEGAALPSVQWGTSGDIPVPGDFDGDGVTDMAVFRPSTGTWFVKLSGGGTLAVAFGTNGDVPVAGDFTGDGHADFAIFRPSTGDWFVRPSSGAPDLASVNWGTAGDVALAAQMSGDSRADKVIWRPSSGIWYVESAEGTFPAPVQWGAPGDIAIAR